MRLMVKALAVSLCLLLPGLAGAAQTVDAVIYTRQGERPLKLELAATPETREHGLMKRRELKPVDGMLFIFPEAGDYGFWMKNTLIPLDMLFVAENRTIVSIAANTVPNSRTIHSASQPIRAVIELDGGRANRDAIDVGDKVRYDLPDDIQIH